MVCSANANCSNAVAETMKNEETLTIVSLTKHVFGGPYMHQLLQDSADHYKHITLMGWLDASTVDYELQDRNLSGKVEYTQLFKPNASFYENLPMGVFLSLLKLIFILPRSSNILAIGYRAGFVALCFRKLKRITKFDYYCLEVYNKFNVKHRIILWLQNAIVHAAETVIVQCDERERLLQDHVYKRFKAKFHPNIFMNGLEHSLSYTSPKRRSECVYSGATNASWARNTEVLRLIEQAGLTITTRDRTEAKYLRQDVHDAFLREFGFAVAIYNPTHDPNITYLGYSSGKINTYLANGIPVFINDDVASYTSLIKRFNCGYVIEANSTEPEEIEEFVQYVNCNRKAMQENCLRAARFIAEYNDIFLDQ